MISIDEQPLPDPSSSHTQKLHQQQQVSYEAFASVSDIDLLKTTDVNFEDTNNSLPSFSIRDYVFESRSKDIACNWPFSDESLQLCLNYGVKNLLPPFQSLDSVRNYRSVSVCAVENCSPNQETISSFDGKRNEISQCHLEEDLAHTKSNSQPIVKKCKLVMKLNLGVEPSEEIAAASKVCPVCKTFLSSSNTTLNAHIDSCLSEESSMKCTADLKIKTVKHRIKHRKTRLMVDVYKTAPRCTIEELDRRNGTNWATSSSFPDQELEFQAEEKNKEPQKPTYVPEAAKHEGAVYIDKTGKKVRILSMPKVSNLDGGEARVLQKGRKGSKVVIKKKNKKAYMPKNDKKIMKLSHKSKKLSKKTESGRKENVVVKESREKEDGGAKPMKAQVNEQMDNLAITRPPWACFKRTDAAKKRFPMYTKRKEGSLLDDDSCENPISSKGSNLSSLKKSLSMPASREHNVGSKLINLKRKFSSLGKSQDALKQKPRTEEDTSKKMSFEMTNDMEVKTKISMTSKSSNGDSSSGGLEIASESAKTEDYIGIEPSFMGLKNSLDNQFSNMISQLDNKFDSQQQRTLDDIIMEQDSEKQGNYYDEVDPIPIPGPPGSFLPPSPGADMGSEEEQHDNSSLTTMSKVQSSEDHRHHDITNQDFISGSSISTVSSPSFARSADKLSARFDRTSVDTNNNNTSDLRSVDASSKEKGPAPCCCSRKEGSFFNNVASYRQESVVSKEPATESNGLKSELFPLVNHLTLPPPEMVKPPVVTPTTPVLRLMGKNLTVVNTDNEQVKPPCWSPMGQLQQPQRYRNEKHDSLFYGHPLQNQIPFSHNQNGSMSQRFNLYAPNNSKSHSDLRSANMDTTATKEIIVIDDLSDNEGHDGHHHDHMFKEPMIRTHAFSFANPYGNGSLQTSSPLQEVANDANHGRWVSTACYPRSFS